MCIRRGLLRSYSVWIQMALIPFWIHTDNVDNYLKNIVNYLAFRICLRINLLHTRLRCEFTLHWQFCTSCQEEVLERLCVWNSGMNHQCLQSRANSLACRYLYCTMKSTYVIFMVLYTVNSFSWDFLLYLLSYFKWI